ncbi:signal transduction histidine kinase (STHK), LytS [Pantanalinema rosaneae CENA516]|uniref:signal transduction histidine kinase (STHK), LytS n=1 Tax=Pantanalinema rosaneae TaxID=1620701 RepID=UPI003D6F960F
MVVSQQVSHHKRAMGVFSTRTASEQALVDLKNSGFPMTQVSIVAKHSDGQQTDVGGATVTDRIGEENAKVPTGVVKDTLAHSAWGTVLVGLTALALPGIGPILTAGSVATAMVASAASTGVSAAATANLVNTLKDMGIPESNASTYSDRLQNGNDLVMIEGNDDDIHRAADVLSQRGIQDWGVYNLASA